MSDRPILGVTMGDPAGVGPEIIAKTWADPSVRALARLLVVGDAQCMCQALLVSEIVAAVRTVSSVSEARFTNHILDVLDLANVDLDALEIGQVQSMAGKAAYESVSAAIELALGGEIEAIVTPPLNKEAMNLAGYHYDGHTGLLAAKTGAERVTMMLVAGDFRVTHVSTHCSMREAIDRVKKRRILEVIRLTHATLRSMGIAEPRIAVAGLNPHAGEGGLFGDEETLEIVPAIQQARKEGLEVSPQPIAPDTVFHRMASGHEFDAVVAMYHDQGHIPTKVLAFSEGVNVTLGLPIIRTSVDHGTAFDIAGQGVADATSLKRAIEVAVQLTRGAKEPPGA